MRHKKEKVVDEVIICSGCNRKHKISQRIPRYLSEEEKKKWKNIYVCPHCKVCEGFTYGE